MILFLKILEVFFLGLLIAPLHSEHGWVYTCWFGNRAAAKLGGGFAHPGMQKCIVMFLKYLKPTHQGSILHESVSWRGEDRKRKRNWLHFEGKNLIHTMRGVLKRRWKRNLFPIVLTLPQCTPCWSSFVFK